MLSLTQNEIKVINFLIRNFTERYSINSVAKHTSLSAKGAYKILKKLEKNKIVIYEQIGQSMYYEINLWNSIGQKATEFALTPNELNGYAKLCEKDIHITKPYAACAGLFGSVLTKGMEANDIDVFCVVERDNYLKLRQKIQEWQKHSSKHIHLFVQTKDDLVNNFKKKDAPLLDILKKGAFFWGQEVIVEAIKNVKNRE